MGDQSYLPALYAKHICTLKSCNNVGHYCLIHPGQIHAKLDANAFKLWDIAIKAGEATVVVPPMSVRGTPFGKKAPNVGPNAPSDIVGGSPFMPPFYSFPMGYPSYPPPHYPLHLQGPHRSPTVATIQPNVVRSSPVDTTPETVSDYMDWVIARHPSEVETLLKVKDRLLKDLVDLDIVRNMSKDDAVHWDIPWGLAKRLKRDVKVFVKGRMM